MRDSEARLTSERPFQLRDGPIKLALSVHRNGSVQISGFWDSAPPHAHVRSRQKHGPARVCGFHQQAPYTSKCPVLVMPSRH